jgi:hypothetical protein
MHGREAVENTLIHAVIANGIGRGRAEICGLRGHLIGIRQAGEFDRFQALVSHALSLLDRNGDVPISVVGIRIASKRNEPARIFFG